MESGYTIGRMGNTGHVKTTAGGTHLLADVTDAERRAGWGTHLHFDRRVEGQFVDAW
jgi:hypothetical protein